MEKVVRGAMGRSPRGPPSSSLPASMWRNRAKSHSVGGKTPVFLSHRKPEDAGLSVDYQQGKAHPVGTDERLLWALLEPPKGTGQMGCHDGGSSLCLHSSQRCEEPMSAGCLSVPGTVPHAGMSGHREGRVTLSPGERKHPGAGRWWLVLG